MNTSRSPVFISHASKNFKIADDICQRLEALGIDCWIAPRDIPPGSSYGEAITEAIQSCTAVVLVLTDEANLSKAVANELEMAFRHQRVIIPVRLKMVEPASSIAFFVNNTQWVDAFYTPLKQRVEDIARIVQAARDGVPPTPPPLERKTLLGSLERQVEGMIRYKFLTLAIVVAVLAVMGGLGVLSTSKVLSRMDADQAAMDSDPSTYGLVTVVPTSDGGPGLKEIQLQATAYMNLKDPEKAQVIWDGFWSYSGVTTQRLDVSTFNGLKAPGARQLTLTLPAQVLNLRFCMTASHPASGVLHTARWDFLIDATATTISVARTGATRLRPTSPQDCQ